jgi:hypothetical protein
MRGRLKLIWKVIFNVAEKAFVEGVSNPSVSLEIMISVHIARLIEEKKQRKK